MKIHICYIYLQAVDFIVHIKNSHQVNYFDNYFDTIVVRKNAQEKNNLVLKISLVSTWESCNEFISR